MTKPFDIPSILYDAIEFKFETSSKWDEIVKGVEWKYSRAIGKGIDTVLVRTLSKSCYTFHLDADSQFTYKKINHGELSLKGVASDWDIK